MQAFLLVTYLSMQRRCPFPSLLLGSSLLFGLLAAVCLSTATPFMTNIIVTLGHFLAMHEAGVSTCIALPNLVVLPAVLGAGGTGSALDQFGVPQSGKAC